MTSGLWERFASRLKTVADAPEPLRGAMLAALKPADVVRLLVFGPADKNLNTSSPATLLALLEDEWILVSGTEEIQPEVHRCGFAGTLLLELTIILLCGKLRLDFVADHRAQSVAIAFNTVMAGLYQEAAQLLLNGMDGVSEIVPRDSNELSAELVSLPFKFCSAVAEFLPMGQRVLGVVHWPAVLGEKRLWWRHEITPEAMLALTDRELLFISEEKTGSWVRRDQNQKYGSVVTHCPLSRVTAVQLSEHDSLDTIDVEVRAQEAGEKLKIDFPREQKAEVAAFLELVIKHQKHRPVNGFEKPEEIK
jgi:hypothetical protein